MPLRAVQEEVAGEVKILIGCYGLSWVGILSNSEFTSTVDSWKEWRGVSSRRYRETTLTGVKVPKCRLSAKEGSPGLKTAGR